MTVRHALLMLGRMKLQPAADGALAGPSTTVTRSRAMLLRTFASSHQGPHDQEQQQQGVHSEEWREVIDKQTGDSISVQGQGAAPLPKHKRRGTDGPRATCNGDAVERSRVVLPLHTAGNWGWP